MVRLVHSMYKLANQKPIGGVEIVEEKVSFIQLGTKEYQG